MPMKMFKALSTHKLRRWDRRKGKKNQPMAGSSQLFMAEDPTEEALRRNAGGNKQIPKEGNG